MYTVQQILQVKGSEVYATHPEATVYEALQLMADKEIGALLVMDGDELVGIFSERDYARKVILQGRSSRETPVKDIMTQQVFVVRPEQSTEECMAIMTAKRIRHLPVAQQGKVVGVISIGDVVKAVIENQEFVIEQLEQYITGGR